MPVLILDLNVQPQVAALHNSGAPGADRKPVEHDEQRMPCHSLLPEAANRVVATDAANDWLSALLRC
jgi:hypothetical protein